MDLLQQCGDTDSNPGPPKKDSTLHQTRLRSSTDPSASPFNVSTASLTFEKEPTMTEMMKALSDMRESLSSKMDLVRADVKQLQDAHDALKKEVEGLRENVGQLLEENAQLKKVNEGLQSC
ncbi:hypothetical protein ACOMHN_041248 [Nucella lapillus]